MSRNNILAANLSEAMLGREKNGIAGIVVRSATLFFTGLLASRATIFESCAPFGVAAVAATKPTDGFFVLLGAMLGYLLPGAPEYSIRYVAAAIAVFLARLLLSNIDELIHKSFFVPLLSGIACAITGIAVVAAGKNSPYEILLVAIEILLCACSSIFFKHSFDYIQKPSGLWGLSQKELISVIITVCILLLALEPIQFSGISLGRITAVFFIIAAARYGKENGGAIMGITAGMLLGLCGHNVSAMVIGYGFGGLIAGIFSPMGRIFCVIAFVLANSVSQISSSSDVTLAVTGIYEVVAASFIFMIVPEKTLCKISGLFVPTNKTGEKKIREEIYNKLIKSANTLDEISEMVSEVRKKLGRNKSDDISEVFSCVADTTCRKCGMRMYCWGTVYNDTMNALNDVTGTLKERKEITREDFPKHFVSRCSKLGDFINAVNTNYQLMLAKKSAEIKADKLRMITAPSLSNTACLMRNIADDIAETKKQMDGSDRIRAALAACGLNSTSSEIYIDSKGRLSIEAEIDGRTTHVSREKLLYTLKSVCGRTLEGPKITESDTEDAIRMSFTQKPQFTVRFGEAEIQKTGETLCGDACETFVDENGRAMMLLSDGMGCGGRAAVDSNLTIGLMSRLLRCGFTFDDAAKTASTAMMVKSGEESFSTVDIACIDLYDGNATFLKAGAPPTFIRRCGRVEKIEPASMPIGILPETHLERVTTKLRSGDLVVVLSDGAINGDDSFIVDEMEHFCGEPKAFAKGLAEKAKSMRSDGHEDDITILAASIV